MNANESGADSVTTASTLLSSSVLASRYEKDVQIQKSIEEQLKQPLKGHLRAVSARWLSRFDEYIKELKSTDDFNKQCQVQRPGPIDNFDLLDLEPVYVNKMKDIMTLDSSKWCKEFTDWEHMTLRTDLKHQDDFCLLSLSNWQKLITAFGGAPEVPFFKYEVESKVTQEDGSEKIAKETKHDFEPIKVHVKIVDSNGEISSKGNTYLVSPHISVRQFQAYVNTIQSDMTLTRLHTIVIDPEMRDQRVYLVPRLQNLKLGDSGVGNMSQVVFIAFMHLSDNNEVDQPENVNKAYQLGAKLYNIPSSEYNHLLHKIELPQPSGVKYNVYQSYSAPTQHETMPTPQSDLQQAVGSSDLVPPEYREDPDLWYAIQASMGNNMLESDNKEEEKEECKDEAYWEQSENQDLAETGETEQPKVEESALNLDQTNRNIQASASKPALTTEEIMSARRKSKQEKFEKMRQRAQYIVSSGPSYSLFHSPKKKQTVERGQLGQPFQSFGDLQVSIMKLRTNFDSIVSGNMQALNSDNNDDEDSIEANDLLLCASHKPSQNPTKTEANKSNSNTNTLLTNEIEVDSECKTDGGEEKEE